MPHLERASLVPTALAVTLRGALALVCSTLLACSEDVAREVSGEWLDVSLPADVDACGGTLPGYDHFIESVAERWGFQLDGWRGRMTVVSPGESGECSSPSVSCASPGRRQIWLLNSRSGEHELVHLLTAGDVPPPFFTEGIATYWGSRPVSDLTTDPELVEPLLESESSEGLSEVLSLGYWQAAGATGLLLDEYGVDRYRMFYDATRRGDSVEDVGRVFEDVFKEPMEPWLSRLSTEPMCNEPIWACEHAIPTTLPIVQDGPLDCADPDVGGFDSDVLETHAPKKTLQFTLDEDTEVEVSRQNVDLVIVKCGDCREAVVEDVAYGDEPVAYRQRLSAGTWSVRSSNLAHEDVYFGLRAVE